MKLALLTFLAVAVCAVFAHPHPTELASGRIIGGVNALPGEFPQICLITWSFLTTTNNVCACAIVNHNHVVTAAHCITEAPTNGRLEVLGGVLDHTVIAPQRQRLGVLQTFIHPHFNAGGNGQPRRNDIAVVRLQSPFVWNAWIQAATLPAAGSVPSGATIIAGWGQTATGIFPPSATFLQKIQAPVVEWQACRNSLSNFGLDLQEEYMCTGPLTGGMGVCNGDAGGPVLQNGVLLGVISFTTSPCAQVGSASVHANVATFRSWIETFLF